MQSILNEPEPMPDETWNQIAPLLDGAMEQLGQKDHDAVVLRFFEGRNFKEVGAALGASEDAAKKRVNRALEKLRKFFTKRGVSSTTAIIAGTISANSVQAAPVALAKTVTAVAIAKGAAASGSTLILIKGALKIMAWTKAKTAIAFSTGILLIAGTTTMVFVADEKWFELNGTVLNNAPDNIMVIRLTHFEGSGSGMVGGDERIVAQNFPLEWALVFANNFPSYRLVLPNDFPKEKFDYLLTLPSKKHGQDEVRSMLRDAIKMKFGLVAHRETREHDVLLLRVKTPNAVGLQKTKQNGFDGSATTQAVEQFRSDNIPMYALASDLEGYLRIPVLDQTGLTNRYAVDLRWNKGSGETMEDTIKRVVLDQLGLELVPSREPIEMLVVEKAP